MRCALRAGLFFLLLGTTCGSSSWESTRRQRREAMARPPWAASPRFRRNVAPAGGCTGSNDFTCYSGECIPYSSLCDGNRDCQDGSDESYAHCRQAQCSGQKFRCSYGGCIERTLLCNGDPDCWDESDEQVVNNRRCAAALPQPTCVACKLACEVGNIDPRVDSSSNSFGCLSGECISSDKVCDGNSDCQDGSDETHAQCRGVRCPNYSFRCQYGACISADLKCNGNNDCADGSDEDDFLCGCRLPQFPANGHYNILGCPGTILGDAYQLTNVSSLCHGLPGVNLAGAYTGLGMRCRLPYELPPSRNRDRGAPATAYCIGGKWRPNFPLCRMPPPRPGNGNQNRPPRPSTPRPTRPSPVRPAGAVSPLPGASTPSGSVPTGSTPATVTSAPVGRCPALQLDTVEPECVFQNRRVSCLDSVAPGTEAKLSCKAFHSAEPEFSRITCRENGQWNRQPYVCKPECGERVPKGQLFVVQGREAEVGQFPWHAGIYFLKDAGQPPKFWCGGSLLNRNFILSAAHCFWDDGNARARAPELFKIGLGKFFRDWTVQSDYTQLRDVRRVEVHPDYRGYSRSYVADIALVWLKDPATFTPFVRPVCVDWQNTFEREQLVDGNLGQVAGWGKDGNGSLTATLQFLEVPFVGYAECEKKVPADFKPLITTDKICAGYTNGSSVCNGDSGGGLAFEKSGRWFVRAIVSVGPVKQGAGTCNPNQLTAYTRVSVYRDWIEDMRDNDPITGAV